MKLAEGTGDRWRTNRGSQPSASEAYVDELGYVQITQGELGGLVSPIIEIRVNYVYDVRLITRFGSAVGCGSGTRACGPLNPLVGAYDVRFLDREGSVISRNTIQGRIFTPFSTILVVPNGAYTMQASSFILTPRFTQVIIRVRRLEE